MRIDLSHPYADGINSLKNWRAGFSKAEYPLKVVKSMFERQYAMNSIWKTQIDSSFDQYKGTETDILKSFRRSEVEYSKALLPLTMGNTLIDLLNRNEDVGGLNYVNSIPLISRSGNGDNTATEELEFTYLYYLLSNKAVLIWSAFGRKGFSRIDAIPQVTGAIVGHTDNITYEFILRMLGQLGVAFVMNKLYTPLPPL